LEGIKNFINKNTVNVNALHNSEFEYDLLTHAIDNKSNQDIIDYCISLYDDFNYFVYVTLTPLFVAVKNNNFITADKLIGKGALINIKNSWGGNILSFLLADFINMDNLEYIIKKDVDLNYNLFNNSFKSLSSFIDVYSQEDEIRNYYMKNNTNNVSISCFDYIIYYVCVIRERKYLILLCDIIKSGKFNIDSINRESAKLIVIHSLYDLIFLINNLYPSFFDSQFFSNILEYTVHYEDEFFLRYIIENLDYNHINKLYNGKTIMTWLMDCFISDDELFDLLYKKGAYVDFDVINNKSDDYFEENGGLLVSMSTNGFIKKMDDGKSKYISTPLIYFIKNGKYSIAEKLLEYDANVNECDSDGNTPIFLAINAANKNLFLLLLNKYHADVTIKNKKGQTPMLYTMQLKNCSKGTKAFFIKELKNKNNKVSTESGLTNISTINLSSENNHKTDIVNKPNNKTNKVNKIENKNDKENIIKNVFDIESEVKNAIKDRNYERIKEIIKESSIDVNKSYHGQTIMDILINEHVDNEELYNLLFKMGAYIDYEYIQNSNKKRFLIKDNNGLHRSFIRNGIIYKRGNSNTIEKVKTPLLFFIKTSQSAIVESLLKNGASVEEEGEDGFTPIFASIKSNQSNTFDLLLNKYHADITKTNKLGQTPLVYAQKLKRKSPNQIMFISELQKYEATLNSQQQNDDNDDSDEKFKELMIALKEEKYSVAMDLLNDYYINVNDINENGETPLQYMINSDKPANLAMLNCLISNAANLDQPFKGDIPIIQAIKKKRVEYIRFLLHFYDTLCRYDGKYIMSLIIDNKIDDEELFNILYRDRAFIEMEYFDNQSGKISLIENNKGLMKSIIRNGLYIKNQGSNKVIFKRFPLIFFISHHNDQLAEKLLEINRASLEKADIYGFTPIFHAIKSNNFSLFKLLLEKYQANINKKNICEETPYLYAIRLQKKLNHNREEFIKELEKYNVNNNKSYNYDINNRGITNTGNNNSNNSINKNNITINNSNSTGKNGIPVTNNKNNDDDIDDDDENNYVFEEHDYVYCYSDYDNENDKDDNTTTSSSNKESNDLLKPQENQKESVEKNNLDDLEFYNACLQEKVELIRKLVLEKKCDVNRIYRDGSTPLLLCIKKGKLNSVKELLQYEVDLTLYDKDGDTPLSYVLKISSPIHDEILSVLLPKLQMDQVYAPNQLTPLYYLIKYNRIRDIKYLAKQDSFNIDQLDGNQDTPLIHVLKHDPTNLKMIEELLSQGANVNYETKDHKIPLIFAIEQNSIELTKLLLKYNADIDYHPQNHITPIKMTIKLDRINICKLLLTERQKKKGKDK